MHQETKPGEATPCQAESIVGTGVEFEKIEASAHDGGEKIYKYVQEPLRKWLANFDTVVVRPRSQQHISSQSVTAAPVSHLPATWLRSATWLLSDPCFQQRHPQRAPLLRAVATHEGVSCRLRSLQ